LLILSRYTRYFELWKVWCGLHHSSVWTWWIGLLLANSHGCLFKFYDWYQTLTPMCNEITVIDVIWTNWFEEWERCWESLVWVQSLELWNIVEKQSMTVPAHEGLIAALAQSSATGMVASASHDKCVKLWK
jgi:hypothetical protein